MSDFRRSSIATLIALGLPLGANCNEPIDPPNQSKTSPGIPGQMSSALGSRRTRRPSPWEKSVQLGLDWLRQNQSPKGTWGLHNQSEVTGLALLAYVEHNETADSADYGPTVAKAVQWVLVEGPKHDGRLSMSDEAWGSDGNSVVAHGILTSALAEYYFASRDERLTELLRKAIGHILAGQGLDGGWNLQFKKTHSETFVTGWQVRSLLIAERCNLKIPGIEAALDRAMEYFKSVQGPKHGYGKRIPDDCLELSGLCITSRIQWIADRSTVAGGIEFILNSTKASPFEYQAPDADLFALYFNTHALLDFGGDGWSKWTEQFPALIKAQSPDGSWPKMESAGYLKLQSDEGLDGQTFRTALGAMTLSTFHPKGLFWPRHHDSAN